MIVIDTCVLSEVFRKRAKPYHSELADTVRQMILDDWPLIIPGIVLQEFLTGFRQPTHLLKAEAALAGFKVAYADHDDHVLAAHIRTSCSKGGVQCAAIDALIAATTINMNGRLLTVDGDFSKIARLCHLKIFDI